MKTKLILAGFIAFAGVAQAQGWTSSGNNVYKNPIIGNVAIGSTAGAATNKVDISYPVAPAANTTYQGMKSDIWSTSSQSSNFTLIGVRGGVGSAVQKQGELIGVYGLAMDGKTNFGGSFKAISNSAPVANDNIGVYGTAKDGIYNTGGQFLAEGTSATQNLGLLISANSSANPAWDWGIYSYGSVGIVGGLTVSGNSLLNGGCQILGVGTINGNNIISDRKLKKEIKPLTNVMDNIKLLKPSTYTFRTDEFQSMNLPKEKQIGLIAQELETVYPELVMENTEKYVIPNTSIK